VKKTIQSGVVELTKTKEQQLHDTYDNVQRYIHKNDDTDVYSATKQQVDRRYDNINDGNEYPVILRNDVTDVQPCSSDIADYFVKVPSAQRHGGIKVPVKTHQPIPDDAKLSEAQLTRHGGQFYIHITVSFEEPEVEDDVDGIIGIDLGLQRPVTGVTLSVAAGKVTDVFFKGDRIKQTQARYAYLRRNSETGKQWKDREHDKVEDELHKVTAKIARKAEQENLAVAVGDLEGIQDQNKGRAMNRKLHRFPHYTFRQMLAYKCRERGVKYIEVDEAYTTKTCYKCGDRADKITDSHVHCNGSKVNRDVNGAANIAQRALTKVATNPLECAGAA
jgi:putative transposase